MMEAKTGTGGVASWLNSEKYSLSRSSSLFFLGAVLLRSISSYRWTPPLFIIGGKGARLLHLHSFIQLLPPPMFFYLWILPRTWQAYWAEAHLRGGGGGGGGGQWLWASSCHLHLEHDKRHRESLLQVLQVQRGKVVLVPWLVQKWRLRNSLSWSGTPFPNSNSQNSRNQFPKSKPTQKE